MRHDISCQANINGVAMHAWAWCEKKGMIGSHMMLAHTHTHNTHTHTTHTQHTQHTHNTRIKKSPCTSMLKANDCHCCLMKQRGSEGAQPACAQLESAGKTAAVMAGLAAGAAARALALGVAQMTFGASESCQRLRSLPAGSCPRWIQTLHTTAQTFHPQDRLRESDNATRSKSRRQ